VFKVEISDVDNILRLKLNKINLLSIDYVLSDRTKEKRKTVRLHAYAHWHVINIIIDKP